VCTHVMNLFKACGKDLEYCVHPLTVINVYIKVIIKAHHPFSNSLLLPLLLPFLLH
jgi:hypothetical protein